MSKEREDRRVSLRKLGLYSQDAEANRPLRELEDNVQAGITAALSLSAQGLDPTTVRREDYSAKTGELVLYDGTLGITITLPRIKRSMRGQWVVIKDAEGGTANTVVRTVDGSSIDGSNSSWTKSTSGAWAWFLCDGLGWYVVAES